MPRARTTRVYKKGSRFYGDFRDIGGKLEALKPLGSTSATDDLNIANALCAARVKDIRGAATSSRSRGCCYRNPRTMGSDRRP